MVGSDLNKRKIGAKAPSQYIGTFAEENEGIEKALDSHFISGNGFGIESDDYGQFLKARAQKIYDNLKARIDLSHVEPANEEIEEIISRGESDTVEFKSTLRYDIRQKDISKKLEFIIAKTIAAFLNSNGGNIFIGIDDKQNALGLQDDFSTLKKQDLDGFELQLIEVIKKYIGNEYSTHIKMTFPEYDGQQICRIVVSPSSKPVFVRSEGSEEFFIRSGCSSQPLSREQQSAYEKEHWK